MQGVDGPPDAAPLRAKNKEREGLLPTRFSPRELVLSIAYFC